MLHFEGQQALSRPTELIGEKLRDLGFLVKCIPDAELLGVAENEVKFRVMPGFSFARGSLDISLQQIEKAPDKPIAYRCLNKGIGSTSEVEVTLTPEVDGEATRVRWAADVKNLTGLLKMVPPALIKAAAQKVIADVWNEVEKQLA